MAIWCSIGGTGWAKILEMHFANPLFFTSSGFPDLIIAKGDSMCMVDVKAGRDVFSRNQEKILTKFLQPLGLSISVLQIVPPK